MRKIFRHRVLALGLLAALPPLEVSAQILVSPVPLPPNTVHLENPEFGMGPRPDAGAGRDVVVVHVNAKPNERHRLIRYFNLGPKCAPVSPQTSVPMAPMHGTLAFAPAKMEVPKDGISGKPFTSFLPATDPRFGCAPRDVIALDINFTPSDGFVGHDTAQVIVTDQGQATLFIFQIDEG
jgi:hypothetical protein